MQKCCLEAPLSWVKDILGVTTRMETNTVLQEAWDGTEEWAFSEWENLPRRGWVARMHRDMQREGNPVGYFAPEQDPLPTGNTLVLAHADETRPEISSRSALKRYHLRNRLGRHDGSFTGTPWTISMNSGSMKMTQAEIYDYSVATGYTLLPCRGSAKTDGMTVAIARFHPHEHYHRLG